MPIFELHNNDKLLPVNEIPIRLERDLQRVTEKNLKTIFGLDFVSSEFALQQFRLDTLSFDSESRSFVIIEYKKDRNFSVIDQGYAYLALMLNNKADFILEYNEKKKENLKRKNVDWTQSRVLFVANSFTTYQQNAINFKDLPIELWEVKKFDNQTVLFNQLRPANARESIKTVSNSKTIESVSKEVRIYSISDHFKSGWEKTREIFEEIRPKILGIDPRVEEKVNKHYIGYKIGSFNLCTLHSYKSKLELRLVRVEKKDLKDPDNKITKIPWREREWGKVCAYQITNPAEIDYAIFLAKQVYEKFYKSG